MLNNPLKLGKRANQFFWQYWGLNLGLCICLAGALIFKIFTFNWTSTGELKTPGG
jgi:hypothetical protein